MLIAAVQPPAARTLMSLVSFDNELARRFARDAGEIGGQTGARSSASCMSVVIRMTMRLVCTVLQVKENAANDRGADDGAEHQRQRVLVARFHQRVERELDDHRIGAGRGRKHAGQHQRDRAARASAARPSRAESG